MNAVRSARWSGATALLAATAQAFAQGDAPLVPGAHDALVAAGPQAGHVAQLWNVYLGICVAVFAAVLIAFAWAVWRARAADASTPPDLSTLGRPEKGATRSVLIGIGISTIGLFVLLIASLMTERALARLPLEGAVALRVVSHQWWWELRYEAEPGRPDSDTFTTANELHVPVGRPVVLTLLSDDVIHSLWVPSLSGKKDLIPGRTATMQFRADKPGLYRGQCAEFCGFQHAYMAFQVIADPPDRYAEWAARQRSEAAAPVNALAERGQAVFIGSSCVMCHAIEGTTANARTAPDLTHVAGRTTLAAGTLPNTDDAMRRWLRDPQSIKPGTNMPSSSLPEDDLNALVAYLRSLQ